MLLKFGADKLFLSRDEKVKANKLGEIQGVKRESASVSECKPATGKRFDFLNCMCTVSSTVSTRGTVSTIHWPVASTVLYS